jgi:hypothetical protein
MSKRPTGITVTAWLWIVGGGFMALGGLMGGLAYSTLREMGLPPAVLPDMPAGYAVMNAVFQHFGLLLVIQTAVAALAIGSGIAFLKLKAWARTAIEGLSWFTLVYSAGFGVFWVYLWLSMTGRIPQGEVPVDPALLQIVGAVIGVVITAALVVPLWIMIRYLRSEEVRAAVGRPRSGRHE